MRNFFRRIIGSSRVKKSERLNRTRNHRLMFDTLESREVPTVSSFDQVVPTTTANNQFDSASASSATGNKVVVWTHRYSATDTDIYAQIYTLGNIPVGNEIQVATLGNMNEGKAAVAIDESNNFIIVWQQATTATNFDIKAARYNGSGVKQGSTITVAGESKSEYDPSVACDKFGNFCVSYTYKFSSSDYDIRLKKYNSSGVYQQLIKVDNSTATDAVHSSVARSHGTLDQFVVAYEVGNDIRMKRYADTGTLLSTSLVATGTNLQRSPSVAIDNAGNARVAWQEYVSGNWDIRARKVTKTGSMGNVLVIDNRSTSETNASVAVNTSTGAFVVAYQSGANVYVREYSANGVAKAARRSLGTSTQAKISMSGTSASNGFSVFMVTFTDSGRAGDDGLGVYRRFGSISN